MPGIPGASATSPLPYRNINLASLRWTCGGFLSKKTKTTFTLRYGRKDYLKRCSIFIAFSLLMIAFPQGSHAFRHPAVTLLRHYGLGTETPVDVNPYIVSILSLHSLHQGKHREDVREFIQWYFSRLNYPDKYGLTGT